MRCTQRFRERFVGRLRSRTVTKFHGTSPWDFGASPTRRRASRCPMEDHLEHPWDFRGRSFGTSAVTHRTVPHSSSAGRRRGVNAGARGRPREDTQKSHSCHRTVRRTVGPPNVAADPINGPHQWTPSPRAEPNRPIKGPVHPLSPANAVSADGVDGVADTPPFRVVEPRTPIPPYPVDGVHGELPPAARWGHRTDLHV